MNKQAIVTVAIGDQGRAWLKIAAPFFEHYAKKTAAAFIIIKQGKYGYLGLNMPGLEKFQMYEMLNQYDRIMYIDCDIIIRPDTPNLFEKVPKTHIGAVYDNVNNVAKLMINDTLELDRLQEMEIVQKVVGDIGWKEGYINTGVIVLSSIHKQIFFNPQDRCLFRSRFQDQTLINYNIQRYGYPIYKLLSEYNAMEVNGYTIQPTNRIYPHKFPGNNKTSAYIMHFAGEGEDRVLAMINAVKQIEYKLQTKDTLIEELKKKMGEIRQKDKEIARVKHTLASLYASRSWQITRPLRQVDHVVRKIRELPGFWRDFRFQGEGGINKWAKLAAALKKHFLKRDREELEV